MRFRYGRLPLALATVAALMLPSACGGSSDDGQAAGPAGSETSAPSSTTEATPTTQTVTDMAGREVELPATIDRVVTLGSVPVINSFLFALGKGDLIANGLPSFAANPRWKYQYVFAPDTESLPTMQGEDRSPAVEAILQADPDVVLTMMTEDAELLAETGITSVVLKWQNAEDVKDVITLLGEILGVPDAAAAYTERFDEILDTVDEELSGLLEGERVTALHISPKDMSQPHIIAQWWIDKAGGIPVTKDNTEETLKLSVEQVVAWNPQVIFVNTPGDVDAVLGDQRLASVDAVRNERVYNIPIAAHTWGNRTSEQPLTVLWAASKLYPEQISADEVAEIVHAFYQDLYATDLTPEQVSEILAGM